MNFYGRSFLKISDFTATEIEALLSLAESLKKAKKEGTATQHLKGKNIALLFEKDSTRTRCSFEVAAMDEGANVSYIGSSGSQIGKKETMKDTARVLGRMYDGIEYRGYGQELVDTLARWSGVPVWNGLTDDSHPTQAMADLLTIREHCDKPFSQIKICFAGDARNNVALSLMVAAARMGMKYSVAAPAEFFPDAELVAKLRAEGAEISLNESVAAAVDGCDFIYTDVWVSMGEPDAVWAERICKLSAYQVNSRMMELTGNPACKFLHCLPAFHNTETKVGQEIFEKFGLAEMEVTDEVFESDASVVFDQAENRMHTIKAVMVATLGNVEI